MEQDTANENVFLLLTAGLSKKQEKRGPIDINSGNEGGPPASVAAAVAVAPGGQAADDNENSDPHLDFDESDVDQRDPDAPLDSDMEEEVSNIGSSSNDTETSSCSSDDEQSTSPERTMKPFRGDIGPVS